MSDHTKPMGCVELLGHIFEMRQAQLRYAGTSMPSKALVRIVNDAERLVDRQLDLWLKAQSDEAEREEHGLNGGYEK